MKTGKTGKIYILLLFIVSIPVFSQATLIQKDSSDSSPVYLDISLSTQYRTALSSDTPSDLSNIIGGTLGGSIGSSFSYSFTLDISLDRVNPEAFTPYSFTKQTDGFHFWPWAPDGESKYSDGVNDHLNFGFSIVPEVTASLLDDKLTVRWAKLRRDWGVGEGSLLLSPTARPFDGIDIYADLAPGVEFFYVTGSLGDWRNKTSEQKMLTAHKIRVTPFPWLTAAFGEAVIWGKRLELSYLNPLMSYFLAQNISTGDMDNIAYIGDLVIAPVPYVSWYFSFFLDEIETDRFSEFFRFTKNQYAFYTGLRVPLDSEEIGLGIPGGEFLFQYTKLEPYVYTHYPQPYPFFNEPVNIAFTHDGENLGYPLPPNSDEFLVKLSASPRPDLTLTAKYRYIRHGTGRHEDGRIEGDINIWLDYKNLKEYPDKNFLHDGVYELIHSATISGVWKPERFPLTLSAEYSFVHGTNYGNVPGNTENKHLIGLGASYSF